MYAMAIHGGAGAARPENYTQDEIQEYEKALGEALSRGYDLLKKGAPALDAVTQAVIYLEDCPLFNAGRGSVFHSDGGIQMDASIMCGKTHKSGAVTLIERIKNPVLAARLVMEQTPHRLLGGRDAEEFALKNKLELMGREYFRIEKRQAQLIKAKKENALRLDHTEDESNTVGAVALDSSGNLAAATSTGGMTNKMPGRVSDTSIIGAGTYASNETLAISATGTGDFFIQNVSCFEAHALVRYSKYPLQKACREALETLKSSGGEGGVIALNREGDVVMDFNTSGMFRAYCTSDGREHIGIFG